MIILLEPYVLQGDIYCMTDLPILDTEVITLLRETENTVLRLLSQMERFLNDSVILLGTAA